VATRPTIASGWSAGPDALSARGILPGHWCVVRNDRATRDIVVVAFTAYAMKGGEARLCSAGCDACLCAGVTPVEPG